MDGEGIGTPVGTPVSAKRRAEVGKRLLAGGSSSPLSRDAIANASTTPNDSPPQTPQAEPNTALFGDDDPDPAAEDGAALNVSAAAGKGHTLVLVRQRRKRKQIEMDEGNSGAVVKEIVEEVSHVLSFGSNEYGQLGHGKIGKFYNKNQPQVIELLASKVVTQIAAGDAHSVLLTAAGHVYTFGFGGHGRLGHGNYGNRAMPTLVENLHASGKRMCQVSAGGFHTAVVARDGGVYTCGSNRYGQLGQGDADGIQATLLTVKALVGKPVKSVAAGGLHTLFIVSDASDGGLLCSCGSNRYGQLGHDGASNEVVPVAIDRAEMGEMGQEELAAIATGTAHSVVLTASGRVFTFGWGANGRLGRGDTPFPP